MYGIDWLVLDRIISLNGRMPNTLSKYNNKPFTNIERIYKQSVVSCTNCTCSPYIYIYMMKGQHLRLVPFTERVLHILIGIENEFAAVSVGCNQNYMRTNDKWAKTHCMCMQCAIIQTKKSTHAWKNHDALLDQPRDRVFVFTTSLWVFARCSNYHHEKELFMTINNKHR